MLSKRASQAAVQHWIEVWAEFQAIAVSDRMDGAAHECDAHHATGMDEPGELVRFEAIQPRPQGEIRSVRRLCLQAHQVRQGGQNRVVRAAQKQLSRQQGSVQSTLAQQWRTRFPRAVDG